MPQPSPIIILGPSEEEITASVSSRAELTSAGFGRPVYTANAQWVDQHSPQDGSKEVEVSHAPIMLVWGMGSESGLVI